MPNPKPKEPPRLFNSREAAEYLGISEDRLRHFRRRGYITPDHNGGGGSGHQCVFTVATLDAFKAKPLPRVGYPKGRPRGPRNPAVSR